MCALYGWWSWITKLGTYKPQNPSVWKEQVTTHAANSLLLITIQNTEGCFWQSEKPTIKPNFCVAAKKMIQLTLLSLQDNGLSFITISSELSSVLLPLSGSLQSKKERKNWFTNGIGNSEIWLAGTNGHTSCITLNWGPYNDELLQNRPGHTVFTSH